MGKSVNMMNDLESPQFTFARISANNISDLVYLMSTIHTKPKSPDYYLKKFNTARFGKQFIGYFAYAEDGEPAAFYGVFPCLLEKNDDTIIACQSGDTITNPKFQKKGLFIELASKTYELAKAENIELVFGFPNAQSSPGFFKKLNWTYYEKFKNLEIQFKNSNHYNILTKYILTKPIYSLYFKLLSLFFKSDGFKNSHYSPENWTVVHDASFFNYKTFGNSYMLQVKGFNFWFKFGDGIVIGDVKKFDLGQIDFFYNALNKLAKILGVKKITVICMKDTFLYHLFQSKSIETDTLEIGYLPLSDITKFDLKFSFADSDTF